MQKGFAFKQQQQLHRDTSQQYSYTKTTINNTNDVTVDKVTAHIEK